MRVQINNRMFTFLNIPKTLRRSHVHVYNIEEKKKTDREIIFTCVRSITLA